MLCVTFFQVSKMGATSIHVENGVNLEKLRLGLRNFSRASTSANIDQADLHKKGWPTVVWKTHLPGLIFLNYVLVNFIRLNVEPKFPIC